MTHHFKAAFIVYETVFFFNLNNPFLRTQRLVIIVSDDAPFCTNYVLCHRDFHSSEINRNRMLLIEKL